ncbi:hypothetical protein CQ010_01595 [Arthrobacter sp. MYb211]|uniref:hypothetical protein n=1 Tax=unclassified Arthrobacter TaxID=235627 RepID=UPI000CFCE502|nr:MULTISPECIES: hypothetical protein [unclassified Arthrobacter]PRA13368.1 hypothetical protein CQ015_03850 [Arthrobacter sp. MYb221]PRC10565.1 hypothetical protein CQ010_01595 [Arthrobacter sp. MYb211]
MAYEPNEWEDGLNLAPAEKLNRLEQGVAEAHRLAATYGQSGSGTLPWLVVASNEAPDSVKATADYVCDGNNDHEEINAAICRATTFHSRNDKSPSDSENWGKVLLTAGRFDMPGSMECRTAVEVEGCGDLTELNARNNNGTGLIKLAEPSAHLIKLSNMFLYGNWARGGSCNGIDFDMSNSGDTHGWPSAHPDSYNTFDNLYIRGFMSKDRHGMNLHAASTANNRGNYIERVRIRDTSADNLRINTSSDNTISKCALGGAAGAGLRVESGNTKVYGVKTFYCDGYGFYIASGRHSMVGLEAQDNAVGFYLGAADASYSGLVADTSRDDGIIIASGGMSLSGFSINRRGAARYATQSNGLRFTGAHKDVMLMGRVRPTGITNPIVGRPGANSWMRVGDGSQVVAVGA